jgi:hypothetical protein
LNSTEELAERQWRDYRAREPGTCFADPDFHLSLTAAYELQDTVARLRIASGNRLVGYKVGCTGPGTTQQFGMQGPIRGRLFESEVRRHGEALNLDDFAHLAIEGEMAVRIGPDRTIAAAFVVADERVFLGWAKSVLGKSIFRDTGVNPDDDATPPTPPTAPFAPGGDAGEGDAPPDDDQPI